MKIAAIKSSTRRLGAAESLLAFLSTAPADEVYRKPELAKKSGLSGGSFNRATGLLPDEYQTTMTYRGHRCRFYGSPAAIKSILGDDDEAG